MSGVDLIAAERTRQINEEGYSPERDDRYAPGVLASAGIAYLASDIPEAVDHFWPWGGRPKLTPDDRIAELVKGGALVAAELDRELRTKGGS